MFKTLFVLGQTSGDLRLVARNHSAVHLPVVWRSTTVDSGGLCVMTPLVRLMPMWHVNSWDMAQPAAMGVLVPWGKVYIYKYKKQ